MRDRFADEVASQVVVKLIRAIRHEGLMFKAVDVELAKLPATQPARHKLLYRVTEAADVLARTPRAVRRLIDKKQLKAVHHGRSVRIRARDLLAFIENCEERKPKSSTKASLVKFRQKGETKWDGLAARKMRTKIC